MTQTKLNNDPLQSKPKLTKPYSKGPYNKSDKIEQWIRISEGCPNGCEYCRETYENGTKPIYYKVPEIIRNQVKILDMNLLYKPKALDIIQDLGRVKVNGKVVYYELTCGIDYRFLTEELALSLKKNRFINIRLAWDHSFKEQKRIKEAIKTLVRAGYSSKDIMIFMVCNWKISYMDNSRKLDLCKVWRVKVADAYFDNQLPPNVKPIFWSIKNIKEFRRKVRKHNQIVNFGIDPEEK